MMVLAAGTGYYIGLVVEGVLILAGIVALVLLLTRSELKKKAASDENNPETEEDLLAATAEESDADADGRRTIEIDADAVVISAAKAETIGEAYASLTDEQKGFYDELKAFAMAKPGAELLTAKHFENVKLGKRSILKLQVKRKTTVAIFLLENELLKKYRKGGKNEGAAIKIKPTEVSVSDAAAVQTAKDMVDLTMKQIAIEKVEKAEERKAKRRKPQG